MLALQRLLGSHASRSIGVSALALTPIPSPDLAPEQRIHAAPSLIQIWPAEHGSKTGGPNKKPRQRGVFDVLRF
ncbi:hypothetical protein CVS37_15555 [Burkholderia lata]|nr:hypothetical protein CVS37_15555 [Burkholderia lata]